MWISDTFHKLFSEFLFSYFFQSNSDKFLNQQDDSFFAGKNTYPSAQSIVRAYHLTSTNRSEAEKPVTPEKAASPVKEATPEKAASPIKEAMKLYGKTVLAVYVTVGLVNLSICYTAISK